MKYGVVLLRAQPIHKGHIDVIKKAVSENERVLVVIGSANKSGTKRNPLTIDFRKQLVKDALFEYGLDMNVDTLELSDWSTETSYEYVKEWGNFFYYNVVNKIREKRFTMYYNDDPAIVENWFIPEIAERVTIKYASRERDVSATKIRKAFEKKDEAYLKEMLCESSIRLLPVLRRLITNYENEDHIMN